MYSGIPCARLAAHAAKVAFAYAALKYRMSALGSAKKLRAAQ